MGRRVLICDDEPFMRRALANCLLEDGWEVVGEAADGQRAVDLFRRLRPDVVAMDVVMPALDGIDALEQMLEIDPHATVVMISALSNSRLVHEALRKGAFEFVAKPFVPEQLRETVRACVEEAAAAPEE